MDHGITDSKRITLRDVARSAGVSTGTVSMVLNNNPLVAELTREHVQRVIETLGYIYDRSAARLRNRRTGIIGVPICNLANPYFAEITAGIEEKLGLALVLGNYNESVEQQRRFLNTAREHKVEGIILMPAIGTTRAQIDEIGHWGIPLVMVSRHVKGMTGDYAGTDNHTAGLLATRHLLDLGHRRIAFVGANSQTSTGRDRTQGYKSALSAAGLPVEAELTHACTDSREEGYNAARTLLLRRNPPTAIVCFNDQLAFGVMLGLRSIGKEPGQDCSVVGTDNVAEAALWQPGLTTVAVPSRLIGRMAGQLLKRRLEETGRAAEKLLLQPELVVRSSSAPPVFS
jgi:LacI family transcriptional regulator